MPSARAALRMDSVLAAFQFAPALSWLKPSTTGDPRSAPESPGPSEQLASSETNVSSASELFRRARPLMWTPLLLRSLAGRIPRQLPPDQRHRNQASLVELGEHAQGAELLAELLRALLPQLLDEIFPGDVTRAIARLAHVHVLLESEQIERRAHPAARRPVDVEVLRFLHREFVRLRVERAQTARRSLREHDPLHFSHARVVVVEPRMHRHLFETRRHAFGTAHPDVVEQ